jgi:hypothetical protein
VWAPAWGAPHIYRGWEQARARLPVQQHRRRSPLTVPGLVLSPQILILSWCASQRDLEVVRKVLSQLCLAYRAEGGTTVRGFI